MYENIVKSLRHCAENDCSPEYPRAGTGKGCIAGLKREAADAIEELNLTHDESAAYQRGLDDAWEAARKIVDSRNFTELSSAFDGGNDETGGFTVRTPYYVIQNYTAAEAIARIRAYEESQEIHVGDEVTCKGYGGKAVVTHVNDKDATILHWLGGASCVKKDHLTKTGRHFPEVAALLDKMKGDAGESN